MTVKTKSIFSQKLTSGVIGRRAVCCLALMAISGVGAGCTTITGVPVSRVPRDLLYAEEKNDFEDISLLFGPPGS